MLPAEEVESDREISEILSYLDRILTDITAAGPAASDRLRAARDAAAAKAAEEKAVADKATVAEEKAAAEKIAAAAAVAEEIKEAEELAKIAAEKAAAAQQLAKEAAEKAAAQKAAAEKAAVEKAPAEKAEPKKASEGEKTAVLTPDEVKEIKPPAPPAAPPAAKSLSTSFQEKSIPEKTLKEQVRRLAYLYSSQQAAGFLKCEQFIFQVAQKVSKKPLYVHTSIAIQVDPGMDSQQIVATVKKSGAAGVLGLVEGLGDAQTRDIAETFDNEDFFTGSFRPGTRENGRWP